MDYFIDAAVALSGLRLNDSILVKTQVNTAYPKTEVVYKSDH